MPIEQSIRDKMNVRKARICKKKKKEKNHNVRRSRHPISSRSSERRNKLKAESLIASVLVHCSFNGENELPTQSTRGFGKGSDE